MSEALLVALSLVLNAGLPYWIVKRDLARCSELQRSRAWPEASFLAAVLAFGPLSLPVHFAKTRRSVPGLGLGFGLCALTLVVESLAVSALASVLGLDS